MVERGVEAGVAVENVGGISETEVVLSPGVTVLVGRNATNRTSFLRAIMAALGSDNVSLKSDRAEGRVELSLGDETFTRTLRRRNGDLVLDGDPYSRETSLADLFAFLLESNDARRAIERGDDLYDVIMQPVDTHTIESRIRRIREDLREIDRKMEERESIESRLTELEARRQDLVEDIREVERSLEEKRAELKSLGVEPSDPGLDADDAEALFNDLHQVRGHLRQTNDRIDVESESIEALEEEALTLVAELDDGPNDIEDRMASIESDIEGLRDRVQSIDNEVNRLTSLIQFNTDLIEETPDRLLTSLEAGHTTQQTVTDALVDQDSAVCWTCGTLVDLETIRKTVDELRDLRKEKIEDRRDLQSRVDQLESQYEDLRSARERVDDIKRSLDDVRAELEERKSTKQDLLERRNRLEEEADELETSIEVIGDEYADALEVHRDHTDLEVELERLEDERKSVLEEIESLESQLSGLETAEEKREEKRSQLRDLQTRIEEIEREAVDVFNERIGEVIEILDYRNIARVWLERLETGDRPESPAETAHTFKMHLVRRNDSGEVYEDRLENLSESEREVIGVVFAVTGYLVHEVFDTVPFMVVDSLEALDSDRIADLIDYLAGFADYLLVALLPADAASVSDEYPRITEI